MGRVNFEKMYRHLYRATRKAEEVDASRGSYICLPGVGSPDGAEFQRAVDAMYAVAHMLRSEMRTMVGIDFSIPKLECLWLEHQPDSMVPSQQQWRLLIRIPDEVSAADVKRARESVTMSTDFDTSRIRRFSWTEGHALQAIHVGPYENLGTTSMKLMDRAEQLGYRPRGSVHEVYLNSPNRVGPSDLQTIVRIPVERSHLSHSRRQTMRDRPGSHSRRRRHE
jgi:hypothetical protein